MDTTLAVWSAGAIDVMLVEANAAFVSCPLSNLVILRQQTTSDNTIGYSALEGDYVFAWARNIRPNMLG